LVVAEIAGWTVAVRQQCSPSLVVETDSSSSLCDRHKPSNRVRDQQHKHQQHRPK
jgi:hypothetical protein